MCTPSEYPSHESFSLQAALCGLLEEAGGEGDRPKRCDGQPLSLGLRDVRAPQGCPDLSIWPTLRMSTAAQAYYRPSQHNMSKDP